MNKQKDSERLLRSPTLNLIMHYTRQASLIYPTILFVSFSMLHLKGPSQTNFFHRWLCNQASNNTIHLLVSKMKILPLEIDIDTSAFSQTTVSFILISAVPFTDELLSSVNVIDFSLLYGLKSVI